MSRGGHSTSAVALWRPGCQAFPLSNSSENILLLDFCAESDEKPFWILRSTEKQLFLVAFLYGLETEGTASSLG